MIQPTLNCIIFYWMKSNVFLYTTDVYTICYFLLCNSLFLTKYPVFMNNMFNLRFSSYNLRVDYILTLPVPKTATFGFRIHFQYHAAKQREITTMQTRCVPVILIYRYSQG